MTCRRRGSELDAQEGKAEEKTHHGHSRVPTQFRRNDDVVDVLAHNVADRLRQGAEEPTVERVVDWIESSIFSCRFLPRRRRPVLNDRHRVRPSPGNRDNRS